MNTSTVIRPQFGKPVPSTEDLDRLDYEFAALWRQLDPRSLAAAIRAMRRIVTYGPTVFDHLT